MIICIGREFGSGGHDVGKCLASNLKIPYYDRKLIDAAEDIGLNRSAVAKWKAGGKPNGTTAGKLADYFGVSTDYLLGQTQQRTPARSGPTDEEIKFALFGGSGEITDAMYDEVKKFAAFIKQREAEKKE